MRDTKLRFVALLLADFAGSGAQVWHLMNQANWTDWAHLVSTDLAHWTRHPSALSPNGDWDGAVTFVDGKPVILYDCFDVADCRPINGTTAEVAEQRQAVAAAKRRRYRLYGRAGAQVSRQQSHLDVGARGPCRGFEF